MGDRRGRNDRIRQNRSQYVSIILICFKMRKREQRFPLLPFKSRAPDTSKCFYFITFYCRTRYGAALQATVPVVVRVVTPAVFGSKCHNDAYGIDRVTAFATGGDVVRQRRVKQARG